MQVVKIVTVKVSPRTISFFSIFNTITKPYYSYIIERFEDKIISDGMNAQFFFEAKLKQLSSLFGLLVKKKQNINNYMELIHV